MFRKKKNGKIQVLFKVYGQFSSTFQGIWAIFKYFSRQPFIFKYFSSLCEPYYLITSLCEPYYLIILKGGKITFVISKAAVNIAFSK